MNDDVKLFEKVQVSRSLVEEIFAFDCSKLDVTDGAVIAKYTLALAQYLVYMQSEINKTRAEKASKQRFLDSCVAMHLDKEILKRFKTKTDATNYVVNTMPELTKLQTEVYFLQDQLLWVEGIDKTISELIATLKRELTRRENELYTTRQERYSK